MTPLVKHTSTLAISGGVPCFGRLVMDMEASRHTAEVVREEEAKRGAVSAGKATVASAWIAFAALMVSIVVIGCGLVFGYAQLIDKVTANAADTSTLKGQMHAMETTVNLIAGKVGVQPATVRNLPVEASLLPASTRLDNRSEYEKLQTLSASPLAVLEGEPARPEAELEDNADRRDWLPFLSGQSGEQRPAALAFGLPR